MNCPVHLNPRHDSPCKFSKKRLACVLPSASSHPFRFSPSGRKQTLNDGYKSPLCSDRLSIVDRGSLPQLCSSTGADPHLVGKARGSFFRHSFATLLDIFDVALAFGSSPADSLGRLNLTTRAPFRPSPPPLSCVAAS